jgi:uncharacterized protein (TIGR00255 family)
MIHSMTGYGQAVAETPRVRVTIEVRSVNNRFADMKLRLPDALVPFEPELRRAVLAKVKRGRVEIDLRVEEVGAAADSITLNRDTVKGVLAAWKTLRDEFGVPGDGDVATLMRVPGVLEVASGGAELDDTGHAAVRTALDGALDALNGARAREGALLVADLVSRLDHMVAVLAEVRARAAVVPELVRRKIIERVEQLAAGVAIDPTRLAQEVAFLADRADVTEEIVRLEGHLGQAKGFLARPDGEPVGKRLEFLLQEVQRETNTIASKSADLDMSRSALVLKAEAEKIREQIQNLE